MALPGTLPVLNREAVELSMMVGIALGSDIPDFCKWDRKNYFYPDLPKGTKSANTTCPSASAAPSKLKPNPAPNHPDSTGLWKRTRANWATNSRRRKSRWIAADLNRAGTPLLEIVSEPDLQSAEEAVTFAANSMRCACSSGHRRRDAKRPHAAEPNVNVVMTLEDGSEVATPIAEVKNLNSFRAIKGASNTNQSAKWSSGKKTAWKWGPAAKPRSGGTPKKCGRSCSVPKRMPTITAISPSPIWSHSSGPSMARPSMPVA